MKVPSRIWIRVVLGAIVVSGGAVFGAVQYFSRDLPSTARLEMIEPTVKTQVFASDGSPIGAFYVEDRVLVPLKDVPGYMRDAIIAVEDRKFYSHWGVDIFGIARALITNAVTHRRRPHGASTITQQLARNLFDMYQVTISRKIKEALLAVRIERAYSKDEILEMYLNQIYFGSGAHGIEAAARVFFGKHARDLTLGEATLLAGIPKNPRDYSPIYHPDNAMKRRRVVLQAMVDTGALTREQAQRVADEPIHTRQGKAEKSDFAGYFLEEVRQYLEKRYGADRVYHDGLRVYTGLDIALQHTAEDSLEAQMRRIERYKKFGVTRADYDSALARGENPGPPKYLQSAVVAIDIQTGLIRALVGGRSFRESKFDRAVQAHRQPGSAFKPFIYLSALENGYTPADLVLDAPVVLDLPNGDVWKPKNFTEKFSGEVTLRYSLDHSINISAIRLLMALGPQAAIDVAHRLGIKSPLQPVYSLALGVSEVTLMELTNAYATIAAGGMRGDPILVRKVVDRQGRVLEDNTVYREEAAEPRANYVLTSMLQSVINEGTGRRARRMGFTEPAAGKTGTTDECTDAWFVGFTPEIAVGVWSGFDRKKTMGRAMTGARVSLPTWTDVMQTYYRNHSGTNFKEPAGIVHRVICEDSGLLATRYCTRVRREVFVDGTEPRRNCDRHGPGALQSVDDLNNLDSANRHILDQN